MTIKDIPVPIPQEDETGEPQYEEIPPEKILSDELRAFEESKYNIVFNNYRNSAKNSIAWNLIFINYDYLHETFEGNAEEPPWNSIVDTAKAVYETIQSNAHKLIKYLNFKKTNTPKPLAILKVEPPKKEVEFLEPELEEGEGEHEIKEPEVKIELPKDIPNYDEIERKWNFKKYDSLIQKAPKKCPTVAFLL